MGLISLHTTVIVAPKFACLQDRDYEEKNINLQLNMFKSRKQLSQ